MTKSYDSPFEIPEPTARGREALQAFAEAQRTNAYDADDHLRRLIRHYADSERVDELEASLREFGEVVMGRLDELARENNAPGNLPRLDRWSDYGTRKEEIEHHPTYHEAGRLMYGSGVMAAYEDHPNSMGALSRFYLSGLNGEAGHNCPIACTAGVIRVLQELADDDLKERFLPGFLNPEYEEHLEGAQFLTELQGGSDVGANGTRAERADDGTWRISGEKWFCSNIDADVFLMTARVQELDEEGTRGLGLFLVPRKLENGEVNGFYIRRLKDKLGTRSMASGECDFAGAVGYHMGEVGRGFKHMMELVINTSRLYNAVGCCAMMRRSFVTARAYAEYREAFGQPIGNYPLVQETLANLRAETEVTLSGTMHLVAMQDRLDAGEVTEREEAFFRMALNLNKARTAKSARWACVEGIEILGGNGAIETFSVLPRLLRDAIVYENWEGTHNTLYMQVWRDMKRYAIHEGYFAYLSSLLEEAQGTAEADRASELNAVIEALQEQTLQVLERPMASASLAMRRFVDDLVYAYYAAARIWERATGDAAEEDDAELVLEHFMDRHLRAEGPDVGDAAYLERISRLAQ